ncbi:MAG: hypothetical protein QF382_07350 [Acidimicrobiales bacterium]|nr:hypothetical protein [Acidimicrobiales bacterium]
MMHLIMVARFGIEWPTYPFSHYFVGFLLATAIHLSVCYFGGMFEYEQRLGSPPWLPKAALLTGVAVLFSAAIALGTGRYLVPRGNLLMFVIANGMRIGRPHTHHLAHAWWGRKRLTNTLICNRHSRSRGGSTGAYAWTATLISSRLKLRGERKHMTTGRTAGVN